MAFLFNACLIGAITAGGGVAGRLGFCLVKVLIGIPCPACGVTRAVHAAFGGDLVASIRFHPWGPVLALITVGMAGYFTTAALLGSKMAVSWKREVRLFRSVEVLLVIALITTVIVRLV